MPDKKVVRARKAEKRRRRVRGKIQGTAESPRLTVYKSLKNVTAQIIDDDSHRTLIGLASNSKLMADLAGDDKSKTGLAKKVGLKIAELAKAQGIETVVFDRNSYRYHGRIKAVAEGAREGGLKF
ncbi:50S ribosomal protein L18 [candidate division GN15 bacterium]|nr:50S ribosomal protein L18 [candidate division GN15 bacterium]